MLQVIKIRSRHGSGCPNCYRNLIRARGVGEVDEEG